jgi:acyl-CoA thioester hydrolase
VSEGAPIDAPFARYEGAVLPEWIDGNGHMNLAYYVVLFDYGTDAIFDALGFGDAYRRASGCGPFAVESHTLYEQELLVGERVRISTLVLGADAKRLHLAHEMRRLPDGARAAMQEVMYLHVDLTKRRVAPFPDDLRARLSAAAAGHSPCGRPEWAGRRIGLP